MFEIRVSSLLHLYKVYDIIDFLSLLSDMSGNRQTIYIMFYFCLRMNA
jgi:hypothetical protein